MIGHDGVTNTSEVAYPFAEPPPLGQLQEVADGVFWLRMPLPMALDHINLWLVRGEEDWTVVDTGIALDDTKALWKDVLASQLQGLPVGRVICTHMHPDHVGMAGWLTRRCDAPLLMTAGEYLLCRVLVSDTGREAPPEGIAFYRAAGMTEDQLDHYRQRFGGFGGVVSPLPQAFERLNDGDVLQIGSRDWHVLVGRGHSPEHACLHCPSLNLVIAGDQILPTISSNVSVWPTEPKANPLAAWLDSCVRLSEQLPEQVLALPAHGLAFYGVPGRLQALIDHHKKALNDLYVFCAEPRRAVDTFELLFRSKITANTRMFAIGEAIAHLNFLLALGLVQITRDEHGVDRYVQSGDETHLAQIQLD